jgi:hypothetical protein
MIKKCSTCKEEKEFADFNKHKNGKFGIHNQCRACAQLWKPTPEALKEARKKTREWNRLKATGFTPEDFSAKFEEQGRVCAICGTDNSGKLDFCADHDHANGTKRGVLCRKCNAGLGHFKDNTELMEKAIMYLNQYKTNEVVS